MSHRLLFILILLLPVLNGCVTSGRYQLKNDQAPLRKPTTLEMADAQPQDLPIYPWSLNPYQINGKKYTPLTTAENYQAQGIASWYGRKFHGHHTANGELYDMFAMTAAHKTLPIPSFVRVTNLTNQHSIIVKVNDRGPFHDNRIIDLSYAAAYALDMLGTGTADVLLEAIAANTSTPIAQEPVKIVKALEVMVDKAAGKETQIEPLLFVQVLASSNSEKIQATGQQLATLLQQPYQIFEVAGIYKLRLGPLLNQQQAIDLINQLKNQGYASAYSLYSQPAL